MKPLKKSYEASEENVHVKISGKVYRCANLKKSGILNKTTILLAHNDVWNEINVLDIGGDNSNLDKFKLHIELNNYKLSDLGIYEESNEPKNYDLTHDDRMILDAKYGFSYIHIFNLEEHLKRFGYKSGIHNVSKTLEHIKENGRTIQEYINYEEIQANEIINNSNKSVKMGQNQEIKQTQRIEFLTSLGFEWNKSESVYVCKYGTPESPARFEVSIRSIEDDDDENWGKLVERIEFSVPQQEIKTPSLPAEPITESAPAKKPVSLETIGNLSPERITEFTAIKATQEQAIKDNPYVEVKTKEDYAKAKKYVSNLLKASTAIDSPTNGIKANKNKFLKQLNSVLDTFLDSMSGMTRKAHDKQKLQVTKWESEEALRIQREQKAEMEKIKTRTDLLFAVPMTFNGTHYSIGTLYIVPSQIKDLSDDEFNALVTQASGIKAGIDAAALANSDKDKQIAELKAMLEKLTGTTAAEVASDPVKTESPIDEPKVQPISASVNQAKNTTSSIPTQQPAQNGEYVYTQPSDDNKLLLAFDLENLQHIEKQAFLKCRAYYIRGLKEAGVAIETIFSDSTVEKKAGPLKELGNTLKNS